MVIALTNIWAIATIILIWTRCSPVEKSWNPYLPGTCWDIMNLNYIGYAGTAMSAAFDFVLSLLPWKIIWGIQMNMREKFGVGIAMSLGLL
jgi:hypothetical protein